MLKFDGDSIVAFKFVQLNVRTPFWDWMELATNLLFPFTETRNSMVIERL
jgi:hypothetical protein